MRAWAERRVEVRVASVATLHFVRERAEEWRQMLGMLSLLVSEDEGEGRPLERWQYLGTFFHPHLGAWVHDLRYRGQEDGPQVVLRMPASERHRPAQELGWLGVHARGSGGSGPPCLELVIAPAVDRAFALVVPVVEGPAVWRSVREALFPAREEAVVLH